MTIRYRLKRFLIIVFKSIILGIEAILTDAKNTEKLERICKKIDEYDRELEYIIPDKNNQ